MDLEIKTFGQRIEMRISGSLDQPAADKMKSAFEGLNLSDTKEVVIDMADVGYIGSAGVGKFLLLYKNIPRREASISLMNLSEEIYTLLSEMQLESIFTLKKR
jgi:anti-sigma B factor antagonist